MHFDGTIFGQVSDVGYTSPVGAAFLQAGVEMGYKLRDPNGEFQTGFLHAQGNFVEFNENVSSSNNPLR